MKLILFVSDHKRIPHRTVPTEAAYRCDCIAEANSWLALKRVICKLLSELGSENVERLLIAGHARCFGTNPLYLEEMRPNEAAELKQFCADPDPCVVAFRHDPGSRLFSLITELSQPSRSEPLSQVDLALLENAFAQIVPDTVERFLAAFRHQLLGVLNTAKGRFELQSAGINVPPGPTLKELRDDAKTVCQRAEGEAEKRRFPAQTLAVIQEAYVRLDFADDVNIGTFKNWYRSFQEQLGNACNKGITVLDA